MICLNFFFSELFSFTRLFLSLMFELDNQHILWRDWACEFNRFVWIVNISHIINRTNRKNGGKKWIIPNTYFFFGWRHWVMGFQRVYFIFHSFDLILLLFNKTVKVMNVLLCMIGVAFRCCLNFGNDNAYGVLFSPNSFLRAPFISFFVLLCLNNGILFSVLLFSHFFALLMHSNTHTHLQCVGESHDEKKKQN